MRVLLFAALCTVVAGNQFQSMVSNLKSTIADVEFGTNIRSDGIAAGRKLVLENIIAGLESMESLSPEARNALDAISPICQSILNDLMVSRNNAQTNLEGLHDHFALCTLSFPESAGNADEAAYTTARNALVTKVTDGWSARSAYISACSAVFTLLESHDSYYSSIGGTTCDPIAATQDNAQAWQTLFETVRDTVTTVRYTSYTTTRDTHDCAGNQALWHAARNDIDAQPTFNAYCVYATTVHTNCVNREGCHFSAESAFNGAKATAAVDDAQRMTDAKVVSYLKCLCETLASTAGAAMTPAELDTACAGVQTADYTAYETNPETVPAMAACSLDVNDPSEPIGASVTCGSGTDTAFTYAGDAASLNAVHSLGNPGSCNVC
jgi:hypothetical protein